MRALVVGVSLDGRDVGVHEDHLDALFLQSFDRLRPICATLGWCEVVNVHSYDEELFAIVQAFQGKHDAASFDDDI